MGDSQPDESGLDVKALKPRASPAVLGPMFYSAAALNLVETIRARVGRRLKQIAIDAAKQDSRNLVTDDDVWNALLDFGPASDFFVIDDEPDDG